MPRKFRCIDELAIHVVASSINHFIVRRCRPYHGMSTNDLTRADYPNQMGLGSFSNFVHLRCIFICVHVNQTNANDEDGTFAEEDKMQRKNICSFVPRYP